MITMGEKRRQQDTARALERGRRAARLLQHSLHVPLSDQQVFGHERPVRPGPTYEEIEAFCQAHGLEIPVICIGRLPEPLRRFLETYPQNR